MEFHFSELHNHKCFLFLQLIKFITGLNSKEKAIVFVGKKAMVDFLSVEMFEEGLNVSEHVFLTAVT